MIAIFILWLFVFALVKRTTAIADDSQYYVSADATPQEQLKFFTDKFNGNYNEASEVVGCESSWRSDVKGDGGKAFAYGQFHKPTFNSWAKEVKLKYNMDLYYENPVDSLALTAYGFSMPVSYKKAWSCYKK